LKERDDLDIENAGLRSKVTLLEGQIQVLEEEGQKGCRDDEKIAELKTKLADCEKHKIEKNLVEKNLKQMTDLLTERVCWLLRM